ncbi:MAG: 2-iminoacetate synthase ThiH [Deltaproteobacteria bacterium]|nr:2-iminoacetate synthase ThiH [Deltaproteobacteria bacterium]
MDFYDILTRIDKRRFYKDLACVTEQDVEFVLTKDAFSISDLPVLLSDKMMPYVNLLKEKAKIITKRRFGNNILLYAPLYISNECVNDCEYCGYRISQSSNKKTLTIDEVIKEADKLFSIGFRHVLLVSGEERTKVTNEYLARIVQLLSKKFASVSIEVGPQSLEEYHILVKNGLDGLTIYQETYDQEVYNRYHKRGPKSDFYRRLITPEYGLMAGIRRLGIGILMGLNDFKFDLYLLSLHLDYLMRKYWRTFYTVSFPRIRKSVANFNVPNPVSDEELVLAICVIRNIFEDVGLVLSTREPATLRDQLIGVGITQMSAGSKTNPGGYSLNLNSENQFDVEDTRTLNDVVQIIKATGYECVFKDWDSSFFVV